MDAPFDGYIFISVPHTPTVSLSTLPKRLIGVLTKAHQETQIVLRNKIHAAIWLQFKTVLQFLRLA